MVRFRFRWWPIGTISKTGAGQARPAGGAGRIGEKATAPQFVKNVVGATPGKTADEQRRGAILDRQARAFIAFALAV